MEWCFVENDLGRPHRLGTKVGERTSTGEEPVRQRDSKPELGRQACAWCGWGAAEKPGFLELSELGAVRRGVGGSVECVDPSCGDRVLFAPGSLC